MAFSQQRCQHIFSFVMHESKDIVGTFYFYSMQCAFLQRVYVYFSLNQRTLHTYNQSTLDLDQL